MHQVQRAIECEEGLGQRQRRLFDEVVERPLHHCVAAVSYALPTRFITKQEPQIRSHRIGFRLYGIADEPICLSSNGSSISLRLQRSRMSVAMVQDGGDGGKS